MTTTGACLVIGLIAAAFLVTWGVISLCRAPRLNRVLRGHAEAEALLNGLDVPFGGAGCGCFWHYLDGGHFLLYTCDAHAYICTPDGEA